MLTIVTLTECDISQWSKAIFHTAGGGTTSHRYASALPFSARSVMIISGSGHLQMESIAQPIVQSQPGLGGRQLYSKEQWETRKSVIRRLYNLENRTYNEVMDILKNEHNFFPTRRQFYRKISEWGFEKKVKTSEMRAIVQNLGEGNIGEAGLTVQVRGQPVGLAKIQRWQKRQGRMNNVGRSFPSCPSAGVSSRRHVSTIDKCKSSKTTMDRSTGVTLDQISISSKEIEDALSGVDFFESGGWNHWGEVAIQSDMMGVPDSWGTVDPPNPHDGEWDYWEAVDLPGSPLLSRLFEALQIECESSIPSLELSLSSSASTASEVESEVETTEASEQTSPNDLVAYGRQAIQRESKFPTGSTRNVLQSSFCEWSLLDWDFSKAQLFKTGIGNMYRISPFPSPPEHNRGRKSPFENPLPLMQDLEIEERQCKNKLGKLKRLLGVQNQQTLAVMIELANIYSNQYRYRQAEGMLRQVAISYQKTLGMWHAATLYAYLDVVDILKCQGELQQALKVHRPVHQVVTTAFDRREPLALRSNSIRAEILYFLGQIDEADRLSRQTLQIELTTLGPRSAATLYEMKSFAVVLRLGGHLKQCEDLLRIILQLQCEVVDLSEEVFRSNIHALVDVLIDQGRYNEGKRVAMALEERAQTSTELEHPSNLYSYFKTAVCLRLEGNLAESESQLRRILDRQLQVFGEKDATTHQILRELSCILACTGRNFEAMAHLEKCCRGSAEIYGLCHPITLTHCRELGDSYEKLGRYEDAFALYQQTLDQIRSIEGDKHPALKEISNWITGLREYLAGREQVGEKKDDMKLKASSVEETTIDEVDLVMFQKAARDHEDLPDETWMNDIFDFEMFGDGRFETTTADSDG